MTAPIAPNAPAARAPARPSPTDAAECASSEFGQTMAAVVSGLPAATAAPGGESAATSADDGRGATPTSTPDEAEQAGDASIVATPNVGAAIAPSLSIAVMQAIQNGAATATPVASPVANSVTNPVAPGRPDPCLGETPRDGSTPAASVPALHEAHDLPGPRLATPLLAQSAAQPQPAARPDAGDVAPSDALARQENVARQDKVARQQTAAPTFSTRAAISVVVTETTLAPPAFAQVAHAVTQLAAPTVDNAPAPVLTAAPPSPAQTPASVVRTLSLRLEPQSLGALDIRLDLSGDRVRLRIVAHTEQAQRLLAQQADQLTDGLQKSGLTVDAIAIAAPRLEPQPDAGSASNGWRPASADDGWRDGGAGAHHRQAPRPLPEQGDHTQRPSHDEAPQNSRPSHPRAHRMAVV